MIGKCIRQVLKVGNNYLLDNPNILNKYPPSKAIEVTEIAIKDTIDISIIDDNPKCIKAKYYLKTSKKLKRLQGQNIYSGYQHLSSGLS